MIAIRFACGHALTGPDDLATAECPVCGERRVSRVTAPAPRFVGMVTGPCARFEALPAQPVRLQQKET